MVAVSMEAEGGELVDDSLPWLFVEAVIGRANATLDNGQREMKCNVVENVHLWYS
jgi:hypothetical protein